MSRPSLYSCPRIRLRFYSVLVVLTCLVPTAAQAQKTLHFSPLGTGGTQPSAISGNGSVVVGGSSISTPSVSPYVWTLDGGMQALPGELGAPGTLVRPLAVSYDGSVIEGIREETGTKTLAVTADGTVRVGVQDNGSVSTVWSSDGASGTLLNGIVDLQEHGILFSPDLFSGRESRFTGVVDLPDGGRRYVGWVRLRDSVKGPSEPSPPLSNPLTFLGEDLVSFVFDRLDTGLPKLRLLDPGPGLSGPGDRSQLTTEVFDISADGRYAVGRRWFPLLPIGVRWDTVTGETVGPEFFAFYINGTSADGSVLTSDVGFVWTEESDWVSLTSLLEAAGLSDEIEGWTDFYITGLSDDGMTFIGSATNPQGEAEGWVATVPEPGGLVLFVALVSGRLLRRRYGEATVAMRVSTINRPQA